MKDPFKERTDVNESLREYRVSGSRSSGGVSDGAAPIVPLEDGARCP